MTEEWQREMEARMNAVEKQMAVDKVIGSNILARLDKIDDGQRWVVRVVIAAILVAFMGFALNGGMQL